MFFRGSRYENIPDTSLVAKDGRTIRYKRMRFIPQVTVSRRTIRPRLNWATGRTSSPSARSAIPSSSGACAISIWFGGRWT